MIAQILVTVAAGVAMLAIVGIIRNIQSRLGEERCRIVLPLDAGEVPTWLTLRVRHVCDDKENAINKDYDFKEGKSGRDLEATLRAKKRQGFDYKCFADFTEREFSEAKEALQQLGLVEVTPDGEETTRAWFLIPGRPVRTTTRRGFRNNVWYPK